MATAQRNPNVMEQFLGLETTPDKAAEDEEPLGSGTQNIKVANHSHTISIKMSEALAQLGTTRKENLFLILRLLEKRKVFNLVKCTPTLVNIEISSAAAQEPMPIELAEIIARAKKNPQNCSGYRVNIKDFFSEDDLSFSSSDKFFDIWLKINQFSTAGLLHFEVLDWNLKLKVKEHFTDVEILQMLNERTKNELDIVHKVILSP
jgi:hypothetical protein